MFNTQVTVLHTHRTDIGMMPCKAERVSKRVANSWVANLRDIAKGSAGSITDTSTGGRRTVAATYHVNNRVERHTITIIPITK